MIELINISKYYQRKSVLALNNVNLTVKKGELVILSGPSGSGKTTLLNIIGTLVKPSGGLYLFEKTSIPKTEMKLASFRANKFGFIPQVDSLIPTKTIYANIALPLILKRESKQLIDKKVNQISNQLGIYSRLNSYPENLSGGEKQRATIARAVISSPQIILADEPTNSLDKENSNEIIEIFNALHLTGTTIIISTHDQNIMAMSGQHIRIEEGVIKRI